MTPPSQGQVNHGYSVESSPLSSSQSQDFDTISSLQKEYQTQVEPDPPQAQENESDYGDFANDEDELEIIDELLAQIASSQGPPGPPLLVTDIEDYEGPRGIHLPKILGIEQRMHQQGTRPFGQGSGQMLRDREASSFGKVATTENSERKAGRPQSAFDEPLPHAPEQDMRSPLERFRRPPKKALSVTDLVSPSWCELQYFYTLTKHGRKRRTPAMKQGTAVHKALEDEVHVTIPVKITKAEDSWGLRIWNIIQGLRTLRDTGLTRELEIWGSIGGEIVNGIIDELSYICPDPKLESESKGSVASAEEDVTLPEYQTSIRDYLLSPGGENIHGKPISYASVKGLPLAPPPQRPEKQEQKEELIYITDFKTRATPTLPSGASIRPTVLQLHLYHHMLENLVQGNFSLAQLAERYGFDTNETFSDSFIAQVGSLNHDLFDAVSSSQDPNVRGSQVTASQVASTQDSMDVLLQHNNLSLLWDVMLSQIRQTFLLPLTPEPPTPTPQSVSELAPPAAHPTRLSPLLTAEYLAPTYRHVAGKKQSIGTKSFMFSPPFLRAYLDDNLAWWRGERPARGVELHEAWKCRSCDFRDDCSWIHERDRAAVMEVEERKRLRELAGVDAEAVALAAKSRV